MRAIARCVQRREFLVFVGTLRSVSSSAICLRVKPARRIDRMSWATACSKSFSTSVSRYGGLRCPSEHFAIRWCDVDWARSRIRVASPKTEHHPGGEFRVIPLFPELLPMLREAFEEAEPGTEYVITRYRDAAQNLRTQFERIVRRAGIDPWPKPFQNLRSTRESELAKTWPLHVVTKWIGNSQPVAMKHYLQVTDDDYDQAAGITSEDKAVQNPVQQAHASPCTALNGGSANPQKRAEINDLHEEAAECNPSSTPRLGDTGLEPVTSRV